MLNQYTIKKIIKLKDYKQLSKDIYINSIFNTVLKIPYVYHYPKYNIFLLYKNNCPIGFLEFGKSQEYQNEFGIKFLGILPKYRGNKLGELLIKKFIEEYGFYTSYIYLTISYNARFLYLYYKSLGFKKYKIQYSVQYEGFKKAFFSEKLKNHFDKKYNWDKKMKWIIMRYKTK